MIENFYVFIKIKNDFVKEKRAFKNDVYACTYAARLAFINKTEAIVRDFEDKEIFSCNSNKRMEKNIEQ